MSFQGFHSGGHLTALALDRLAYDPPTNDDAFASAARAHLASCAECAAALASFAERDGRFDLAPSPALFVPAKPRPRVSDRVWVGATVLAAAALMLFVMRAGPAVPLGEETDRFIAKGGSIELAVRVHDGKTSRVVDDGAEVHPGEKAGFALRASEDGFVLVFGWDTSGKPYAAYPAADLASFAAVPIAKSERLVKVAAAMRFDDVLGDEHLAAVYCPEAFAFGDLVTEGATVDEGALRQAVARAGQSSANANRGGCALRHIVLHKRDPGPRP